MAPEIIRGSKNYTTKCDIYSFGIIMWQVIARRCWHDDPDERPTSEDLMKYFSILKKEYPKGDDPLIDTSTNEPAVTPQPKANTPIFQKHRRGRSDQSTLIKLQSDIVVAPAFKKDEILNPNIRNCRSHSEITYRKESLSERLGPVSRPVEMPANVLDYIDHSLRVSWLWIWVCRKSYDFFKGTVMMSVTQLTKSLQPADPVVGDEASEQLYNEHIAACHELYDYDLSLQRALAEK
ncbi:hypothetical protein TELCIR_15309 [Teladorsagia circumcincta]|uniref:Protein kinase domain-containing protein n=1 Tax=Teladorsagia circumcincta TaxID=45464 RepID=A0A2G9TYT4_TELCI|nr:hypothetical protein TELCIR_15309 [Teladorsagia circumcincta]